MDSPIPEKPLPLILVASAASVWRHGLITVFSRSDPIARWLQVSSARRAIEVTHDEQPRIVILDEALPDMEITLLIQELDRVQPGNRCLIVGNPHSQQETQRILDCGPKAYVSHFGPELELVLALRNVLQEQTYLAPFIAQMFFGSSQSKKAGKQLDLNKLTFQEQRVWGWLAEGSSNAKIAKSMGLSGKTIESHYAKLKTKLKIRSTEELRQQAIIWKQNGGQFPPSPSGHAPSTIQRRRRPKPRKKPETDSGPAREDVDG